ncbi:MAG TPA: HEAT repeat domain-containing protein [Polyangiaceae bacterium]|nr:HEAT repeat domain-containing protein [Polyangiaceae bacterium]
MISCPQRSRLEHRSLLPRARRLTMSMFGALWLLSACGPSELNRTALQGDLPTLQHELQQARTAGKLGESETRSLALAVARRELMSSKGDEGVERVRELRPCLNALASDFDERASRGDAVAAAATLALLEAGRADRDALFDQYASSADPMWRAVAARAAVGAERKEQRTRYYLDGDLRVRRSAFYAALEAPDETELAALLEAGRLDPDPLVRSVAIRALGAIGSVRAVTSLRDLWATADDASRQGIVDAWATTPALEHGGRAELGWVLDTQQGMPRVIAAARLVALAGPEKTQALGVLERTLQAGPSDEQRLALLIAPKDARLSALVEGLAQANDEDVAVLAAAALARDPAKRSQARQSLLGFAQSKRLWVARQARAALVVLGEQSLAAALKTELSSTRPEQRRQAAIDLLRLGRYADAATALADSAAAVRTQIACELLTRG